MLGVSLLGILYNKFFGKVILRNFDYVGPSDLMIIVLARIITQRERDKILRFDIYIDIYPSDDDVILTMMCHMRDGMSLMTW